MGEKPKLSVLRDIVDRGLNSKCVHDGGQEYERSLNQTKRRDCRAEDGNQQMKGSKVGGQSMYYMQ